MTDQQQAIRALYRRAADVLGSEAWYSLVDVRQRGDAFSTALSRAAKAMDGAENVTDEQIVGAFEIADEVWPVDLEVMARTLYRDEDCSTQ